MCLCVCVCVCVCVVRDFLLDSKKGKGFPKTSGRRDIRVIGPQYLGHSI